jgi:hypothetical protein
MLKKRVIKFGLALSADGAQHVCDFCRRAASLPMVGAAAVVAQAERDGFALFTHAGRRVAMRAGCQRRPPVPFPPSLFQGMP